MRAGRKLDAEILKALEENPIEGIEIAGEAQLTADHGKNKRRHLRKSPPKHLKVN